MSILLGAGARIVIFGITGRFGSVSIRDLRASGSAVVAGVVPGRGGEIVEDVPVFGAAAEAVRETGADCALVYVPAPLALDAVLEAVEAGCRLIAYPGDGLPVADAMEMRAAARGSGAWLVGPNSPGLISPGRGKLGFMPSFCFRPGPVGLISRSGSLSYEAAFRLSRAGIGQSTAIGIGGDPVKGVTAAEAVALFHADPETHAILYLGEIGGTDEYAVAAYARRADAKPVTALLVGRTAPKGRKMGHAAALIGGDADGWEAKTAALEAAGVTVARSLDQLPAAAGESLARAGLAPAPA